MPGALTRWDPLAQVGELRSRVDGLFDELANRPGRMSTPPIDVVRDDGNLIVRADIPGVRPEEIEVEVEDGVLSVSGEYHQSRELNDKHYLRRERSYGSFSRSLALPAGVDASQITATTKDGVVEVTVPVPEEVKKEKVTISPVGS
jgi:HSP20 family protein